jgi:glycosyltransferase involved in cell wall biosynthesis
MTQSKTNTNGPLVTVLLSTYNRPHYLPQALASVFCQTWPAIEIILVRDGGTPVREVIGDFLDDPRLTLIDRPQNRGKAYSFNEAIHQARGEFVCYLDDDDCFYPFHVETLANALLGQDRCQAVYSDLYKVHCRELPGGRRIVLAKNVEVSRDFDRMLMLQFNQALHVSLMHRRDLFDKTGLYNEKINVLIDWDMTRRLCFYTDFLHVPVVTGEFYAPVDDCDRISVKRRKNVNEYLWNLLTIRTTRPAKPWPCIDDLSVVVLPGCPGGPIEQTLRDLWSHTYYPSRLYVPLTPSERERFNTSVPNVIPIAVAEGASAQVRLDSVLKACEGEFLAIVPTGLAVQPEEVSFLERSLNPLLDKSRRSSAFELVEATADHWGVAARTGEVAAARQQYPDLSIADSMRAAGIAIHKTKFEDYPFQFDNFLAIARQFERDGEWRQAIKIYDYAAERFDNTLWMQTLKANALYYYGRWEAAAALAGELNQTRPTVARLMIEARARRKLNDFSAAAAIYRRAAAILDGHSTGYSHNGPDAGDEGRRRSAAAAHPQQETLQWTS